MEHPEMPDKTSCTCPPPALGPRDFLAELRQPSATPLSGTWHHGGGYVVCGTIRVFAPSPATPLSRQELDAVLDWLVTELNAAQAHPHCKHCRTRAGGMVSPPLPALDAEWCMRDRLPTLYAGEAPLLAEGFDTNPAEDFKQGVLAWICSVLNERS